MCALAGVLLAGCASQPPAVAANAAAKERRTFTEAAPLTGSNMRRVYREDEAPAASATAGGVISGDATRAAGQLGSGSAGYRPGGG